MTRASELKKSDVIEVNGTLYAIRQIEVQSPSARGAATLYRVKASAVGGGPKFEERFKGDDDVATVELQRRPVQFSYVDGDDYIFMVTMSFIITCGPCCSAKKSAFACTSVRPWMVKAWTANNCVPKLTKGLWVN